MNLVRLLPHQGQLVQAPFVYPNITFFFLVAGYASGKTSSLVYAILHTIKLLLGKKDLEAHNPKMLIASKNLTFMKKTLTGMLEQDLKETNSEYTYDKAHNIITVGNVELLLIPDEDESSIYGFSCCCAYVDELDELDTQTAMAVVKSINDRCRQQVDGFRTPFMVYTTSSQGLKGTYQTIMHFKKSGIGYVLMRARTKDNIYLPKDYVNNMYSIYNEKEIACLLEGQFVSIDSGLVFPDYNPALNKLDVDLFDVLKEDDTVYIGQDFNCIQGDVLIDTLRGKVKIKNIKEGDYVLTRKGYKKVLYKACKGVKTVQDFNKGLVATPDHVAITPEGEVELCKAKQFYCLKEQCTESLKEERKALLKLLKLKKLLLKAENTTGTQQDAYSADITSTQIKEHCIEIYTRNILEKYGKEIISTIKTESMITDLKILKKFLVKLMQKNISLKKLVSILKLQEKDWLNIIYQQKADSNMVKFLKTLGKKENTLVQLFAWIVINSLKLESELLKDVKNVKRSGIFIEKENAIKVLKELVLFVENILQERVQQNIVKSTKVIGKDLTGKERLSKVYDIEVEDAHEFYANGILVHNCFGNNAIAFVVKKGCIIAIKDYEFPDIRRAPEVFRYDFPTQKIVWIPDMTYKEHFAEFKKELRTYRISIAYRSCNPLVADRNFACNKLFYAERLFICPICKDTEKTLLTWQKDPKTGAPSKGGHGAPDHKGDCIGYVVHYLLSWCRELKPLYDVTLRRLYDKRREQEADAVELEVQSQTLSADKIKSLYFEEAANNVDGTA